LPSFVLISNQNYYYLFIDIFTLLANVHHKTNFVHQNTLNIYNFLKHTIYSVETGHCSINRIHYRIY